MPGSSCISFQRNNIGSYEFQMVIKEQFFLRNINELMDFYISYAFQSITGIIIILMLTLSYLSWSVCRLKKNFQTRGSEREIKFIRVGDTVGRPKPFRRLIANFYSLKTEKIPSRRVALGDWLGCQRVGNSLGIFTKHGIRDLAGLDNKAQSNSCYAAW